MRPRPLPRNRDVRAVGGGTGAAASRAHYVLKTVLIGDSGVGKSVILSRYTRGTYSENHVATIGIDFAARTVPVRTRPESVPGGADDDEVRVKLQLWDTAGKERFRSITRAYYHGAYLFLVVFSVRSRASFEGLRAWLTDIRLRADTPERFIAIVGNQCDGDSDGDGDEASSRDVPRDEAARFAATHGVPYYEVSAKHDDGEIDRMMQALTATTLLTVARAETAARESGAGASKVPHLPNGIQRVPGVDRRVDAARTLLRSRPPEEDGDEVDRSSWRCCWCVRSGRGTAPRHS